MPLTAHNPPELQDNQVTQKLGKALGETMVETAKAQTYHWNFAGTAFGPIHALIQEIYQDHFAAQDRLAERIKALGGHADGRPSVALSLSGILECEGNIDAREMVQNLALDQQTLSATLSSLARAAEEHGDMVSQDLAIKRVNVHDEFAWILASHLEH